jgi:hypothetical protein
MAELDVSGELNVQFYSPHLDRPDARYDQSTVTAVVALQGAIFTTSLPVMVLGLTGPTNHHSPEPSIVTRHERAYHEDPADPLSLIGHALG